MYRLPTNATVSSADGIVSYQIPEDSSVGLDLNDVSYDGERINGVLRGGLGRLVDGEFGGDNFRLDIGYGKGNKPNHFQAYPNSGKRIKICEIDPFRGKCFVFRTPALHRRIKAEMKFYCYSERAHLQPPKSIPRVSIPRLFAERCSTLFRDWQSESSLGRV